MYHPVSLQIFHTLQNQITSLHGKTTFCLGNTSIEIESKDGIGGLLEEWFGHWAKENGFAIRDPKKQGHSQEFPDFYVGEHPDEGLLEVKAFLFGRSPNFDLANFESYCYSLANCPDRLDSDYLIFGYSLTDSTLQIEKIWLKKIWQITCGSRRWPLKTQTKRNVIYNIRPACWYSDAAQFPVFGVREDFVDALYKTQQEYNGQSLHQQYIDNSKKPK